MSEEKETLKVIDSTIDAVNKTSEQFLKITEVLQTAKSELIKLEMEKDELNQAKSKLEEEKNQLEEAAKKLETEKKGLEIATKKLAEAKNKLEEDKIQLEKDKQERDEKIGAMTAEQERLLKEYEVLKEDLAKFAKLAEEAEEAEFNFERIRALLSIYSVLVTDIWQGQPHYRILLTLHGEQETMTREQIKNTTGIGGAFVLRAVQELANVDLVEYDEDTATVTLKRRLFEKKALTEKEGKINE